MKNEISVHSGHRQRMKERFLAGGFDSFSPHEIIELLLYYSIPQKDVNELAHKLIERFGSVAGVIEADYYDLLSVDGVGPGTAQFFRTLCELQRRYSKDKNEIPKVYTSIQEIGRYAVNLFVGVNVERLYALMYDNKMRFIDEVILAEGTVNAVNLPTRKLLTRALKRDAASVVLVHNHPGGNALPSQNDIVLTEQIASVMEAAGLTLIDHLVVAGQYYTSLMKQRRCGTLNSSAVPDDDAAASGFFDEDGQKT